MQRGGEIMRALSPSLAVQAAD